MVKLIETVTKGGKIDLLSPMLNDAKLMEADRILTGVSRGEHDAISAFKKHMGSHHSEAIHTTGDDFAFAFGQLTAFAVANQWEAAERTWTRAIGTLETSSFNAPKTYGITPVTEGFARPQSEPDKPAHIVPLVPEGSPYPHFKFSGQVAAAGQIHKAGGQYDLTFEEIINDVAGLVPMIPQLITESLLEREEYDAWSGLIEFIDQPTNHLQAGTTLTGAAVPADAPLSFESLSLAIQQAQTRQIGGRTVRSLRYNLIVPQGQAVAAGYVLNGITQTGFSQTDGAVDSDFRLNFNPFAAIAGIVETEYLTGTQWGIIPVVGAVPATSQNPFYYLGRLRGHIGPEIRVQNLTGQYLGGGNVPPFEGSFATDSASFRGRVIDGGLGWEDSYAVISDGDGVLTP